MRNILCKFGWHQWELWSKPRLIKEWFPIGLTGKRELLIVEVQSRTCKCCGKYQERYT